MVFLSLDFGDVSLHLDVDCSDGLEGVLEDFIGICRVGELDQGSSGSLCLVRVKVDFLDLD